VKAFDQLSMEQKEDAINMAFYELTNLIADGTLEITLIDSRNQTRLDKILADARKSDNQRLVKLHIIHDKPIRKELTALALVIAHMSEYGEDGNALKEADCETAKRVSGQ
jgi:hypothetical protein